jgi:signal transduction histidine kinase
VACLIVSLVGIGVVVASSRNSSNVIVHRADAAIVVSSLEAALEDSAEATRNWLIASIGMASGSGEAADPATHFSIMDHPEVADPIQAFRLDLNHLDALLAIDYHPEIIALARSHGDYVRTLQELHYALETGGEVEAHYYTETLPHEASARIALSALSDRLNTDLGAASSEMSAAEDRLITALPVLIMLAAAGGLAVVWILLRVRKAREQTLKEVVFAKDEFLARVSHELRTPLTAVVGFAAELDHNWEGLSEGDRAEMIHVIRTQGDEVSMMVEDLLVAARSEMGTLTVVPEPTRIGEALDLAMAGSYLNQRQVTITPDTSMVEVWADPVRLRQILRNLLVNAARYGGIRVLIRAFEEGDSVTIRVEDDGPGVPEELRQSIFEPYFRGPQSQGQPASIGLGLAVSRELARMMGGDLQYVRRPGWSVFEVTLPGNRLAELETRPDSAA